MGNNRLPTRPRTSRKIWRTRAAPLFRTRCRRVDNWSNPTPFERRLFLLALGLFGYSYNTRTTL
jgi:hypothetical protein